MTTAEWWMVYDARVTQERMYGTLTESEVAELYEMLPKEKLN